MKTLRLLIFLLSLFSFTTAYAVTMQIEINNKSKAYCHLSLTNIGWLSDEIIKDAIYPAKSFKRSVKSSYLSNLVLKGQVSCSEFDKHTYEITNTGSNLSVKEKRMEDQVIFTAQSTECYGDEAYFCFSVTIRDNAK